ncbi:hypothetical protein DF034_26960 [Burkholderia anthina]|nr:hypothetical protein DF034_26960 [Burkholderia anthina]
MSGRSGRAAGDDDSMTLRAGRRHGMAVVRLPPPRRRAESLRRASSNRRDITLPDVSCRLCAAQSASRLSASALQQSSYTHCTSLAR